MPDLNKAYTWAIQTCNSPTVGYWTDNDNRNQRTVNGITYYDCSSFINYALLAGGWETPSYAPRYNAFTTVTMPAELRRLGWAQVDPNGQILAGDIGLSSGHTEMCYQGGVGRAIFMGAHFGKKGASTSNNGILLQNQVSIGNSGGDATATRTFPQIWRYGAGGATGYGVSLAVISAICGNAWRESHVNPCFNQEGGGAYGIFQWDGSRRTAFETWCTQNGYSLTDGNAQLQYLIVEDFWSVAKAQEYGYPYHSLTEFLQSTSTDIAYLTEVWCRCWEIAGVEAMDERIEFAQQAQLYIMAHAQDTSIIDWIYGQRYLSTEEALHNCIFIYRFLSAGGGGGGTFADEKKGMPLWMKIKYHY